MPFGKKWDYRTFFKSGVQVYSTIEWRFLGGNLERLITNRQKLIPKLTNLTNFANIRHLTPSNPP